MKLFLLKILVLFPILVNIFGFQDNQEEYYPGGIILLDNSIITVKIKKESILNLQSDVTFIDDSGVKKTLKPGMIDGYYFDTEKGRVIFESHNDINTSAFNPSKRSFLCRLSNDYYPLFYYIERKSEYVGTEAKILEVLNYLINKNNRWHYFTSENYKDFAKIFDENKTLSEDIKNDKYSFEEFPDIVKRYCKSVKKSEK